MQIWPQLKRTYEKAEKIRQKVVKFVVSPEIVQENIHQKK